AFNSRGAADNGRARTGSQDIVLSYRLELELHIAVALHVDGIENARHGRIDDDAVGALLDLDRLTADLADSHLVAALVVNRERHAQRHLESFAQVARIVGREIAAAAERGPRLELCRELDVVDREPDDIETDLDTSAAERSNDGGGVAVAGLFAVG